MNWRKFPYAFVLLVVWIALKLFGLNITMDKYGAVFCVVAAVILIFEFRRSADIGSRTFNIEKATSLFTAMGWIFVVGVSIGLSWAKSGTINLSFGDIVMGLVAIADDLVSSGNSFDMALKNFAGSVSSARSDEVD